MSSGATKGLQVLLLLAIIGLSYLLYRSIKDPYRAIERDAALTSTTRARMDHIRTAQTRFKEVHNRFLSDIDSLTWFVGTDSLLTARPDSLFRGFFNPDSMIYSARGGKFKLSINDTSRVAIYYLEDPNSDDTIGASDPDITMVNAASWE